MHGGLVCPGGCQAWGGPVGLQGGSCLSRVVVGSGGNKIKIAQSWLWGWQKRSPGSPLSSSPLIMPLVASSLRYLLPGIA